LKKSTKKFIHLFEPFSDKQEIEQVSKIIKNNFWASGSGNGLVSKFENLFRSFIGSKKMIAVNNGTSALQLSLNILDVSKKEILVPSLTFVSTAHAAVTNNATPKFVDVDESTLCIDLEDLEKKITKNSKVIIPVHFGGYPCDLRKLNKIKRDYNLHIVEDAAHACGTTFNNKKIGSHNELVCFSFHPVKNLAMPTGGAIAINDNGNQYDLLKSLRWCGITDRQGSEYDVDKLGWNFYMNEISAGMGLVQLKRLNKLNKKRKQIAKLYHSKINLDNKMPYSNDCSYHLYWIRVKNRTTFMKKMFENGIETGIHYKPVHKMTYYKNSTKLETCDRIWQELVSIPMHPNLSENQVEKIINTINSFV
jgi:dTDP-4-amino-4,6-dideoxygalactose transaminase